MNDKESKIVEKILLILKKKKNKNTSLTSKSTTKHLRSRKLVLNHLELYRSAQEINSQPNFLRLFDFPIPKPNTAINPFIPEKSTLNETKIISPYDMIENFLRITMIENEHKEIFRYKIAEKFSKDYRTSLKDVTKYLNSLNSGSAERLSNQQDQYNAQNFINFQLEDLKNITVNYHKEFLKIPNQFSNILENSPWFYTSDIQGKTIEFGHNKLWSDLINLEKVELLNNNTAFKAFTVVKWVDWTNFLADYITFQLKSNDGIIYDVGNEYIVLTNMNNIVIPGYFRIMKENVVINEMKFTKVFWVFIRS